jgi:hypothetical protein
MFEAVTIDLSHDYMIKIIHDYDLMTTWLLVIVERNVISLEM